MDIIEEPLSPDLSKVETTYFLYLIQNPIGSVYHDPASEEANWLREREGEGDTSDQTARQAYPEEDRSFAGQIDRQVIHQIDKYIPGGPNESL